MVFVRSLYARLAKWQLALITFVICLIFMLSLFPSMNRGYTMNNDPTVIDLQLSFTEARFSKIVDTWIEHKGIGAVEAFRRVLLTLDYAFPVLYALFLASLSATIVTKFIVKQPGKRDLIFFVLPFAAGLFDLIENTLHLIILGGVNEKGDIHNLSPILIFLASLAALIKFVLLVISFVVIITYVYMVIRARVQQNRSDIE